MTVESLVPITEAELLKQVKTAIGMNGNNYNDSTIQIWIDDVKLYLSRAGVRADVLGSTLAVGCISRGVDDKWVSHREDYSDMFHSGADVLRDVKVKGAELCPACEAVVEKELDEIIELEEQYIGGDDNE